MPVKSAQRGNKVRIVEADSGRIARNKAGTPMDGGGHSTKSEAARQVRAVNRSLKRPKRRRG